MNASTTRKFTVESVILGAWAVVCTLLVFLMAYVPTMLVLYGDHIWDAPLKTHFIAVGFALLPSIGYASIFFED